MISVIIPTYNRAKHVTKAIDSVLAQSYTDYEIIVVDDGSTDNTRKALEPYTNNIKYIYQPNAGVSSARNNGIKSAQGQWIAFLDSDKLAVQMDFVERYPLVVAHSVNIDLSDYVNGGHTSFSHCGFIPTDKEGIIDRPFIHHFQHCTTMMPPAVICKKQAALQAGLFDESLSIYEDYDFMCRLALQGSWGYSSNVLVKAHSWKEDMSQLSAVRSNDTIKTYMSLIKSQSKLLSEKCLNNSEKKVVSKLLSENYRKLGRQFLRKGLYNNAREAFINASKISFSYKCLIWYMFSRLPGSIIKQAVYLRGR